MADKVDVGFIHACNWDKHLDEAEPFIKCGTPVMIDKPIVGSVKDIKRLRKLVRDGAKILGASSARYADEVQEFLKRPIEERGKIVSIFGTCGVDEFNYGIHIVEIFSELAGAKGINCRFDGCSEDIDGHKCEMYKNGALGIIQETTSVNPGYPRIIEISGTNGTIVMQEDTIVRWDLNGKELDPSEIKTSNYGGAKNPWDITAKYHTLQIKDLIDAIHEDRRPMCDIYEGKKPVDIILAAYESNRTGQRVYLD